MRIQNMIRGAAMIVVGLASGTPAGAYDQNCLAFNAGARLACLPVKIEIYTGPQSASPGDPLYIAVEVFNSMGRSMPAGEVIISNSVTSQTWVMPFTDGLGGLTIAAPERTGRVEYQAHVSGIASAPDEVLVMSGPVRPFTLESKFADGAPVVMSSVITDTADNIIEDGTLAHISYMRDDHVVGTSRVQILDGRVSANVRCVRNGMIRGDITDVRVSVKSVTASVSLGLCQGRA